MKKRINTGGLEFLAMGAGGMTPSGPIGQKLLSAGMDTSVLKPYIGDDGYTYMTRLVNGKFQAIRINANATLRKDEWKQLDDAVLFAAQERLVGVADLYSRNLVYRIGNGLGKTVLEYEDVGSLTDAELTMDAVTPTVRDRIEYSLKYLPLPIIHKDFSYNARVLAASRNGNTPLDTTTAMLAARQVSEKVETILFQGASSYAYGGGTLYGYVDFPSVNDVTLTANWDASAKTGEDILDDVRAMKQASIDAKHYGPWVLYVPTAYETVLDDDYKDGSDKTIRQRILEIAGITEVKVVDKLAANNVLLVQMTSDVVRMVEGMALQTIEWQEGGGFTTNFKVLTIMVPQIRADQDGNCGVTLLKAA
jgi:uncharacterized linocin/CFP29 family protein